MQLDLVVLRQEPTTQLGGCYPLQPPLRRVMCRHSALNHRVVNISAARCTVSEFEFNVFKCNVVLGWYPTVTLRWVNISVNISVLP